MRHRGYSLYFSVYVGARAGLGTLMSIALLVLLALFLMVAKVYVVISAAITFFLILAPSLRLVTREFVGLGFAVSMLLVLGFILVGSIYFRDYPPFSYMQGVLTSFNYRLELWSGHGWLSSRISPLAWGPVNLEPTLNRSPRPFCYAQHVSWTSNGVRRAWYCVRRRSCLSHCKERFRLAVSSGINCSALFSSPYDLS